MPAFNKQLLGRNIKYLATQKGMKVGDLENQVEVSAGYFSRLSNDDGKNTSTLMDTICKVATKLETSVNTLISTDLSVLTPNETLLSQYFDRIGKDTAKGTLVWELETISQLESPNCKFRNTNPLFCSDEQDDDRINYNSYFDTNVIPVGDLYRVTIREQMLYLIKVNNKAVNSIGYEVYLHMDCGRGLRQIIDPLCKAYPESALFNQIEDLYKSAVESSHHVKLSESALISIHNYLNPCDPFAAL